MKAALVITAAVMTRAAPWLSRFFADDWYYLWRASGHGIDDYFSRFVANYWYWLAMWPLFGVTYLPYAISRQVLLVLIGVGTFKLAQRYACNLTAFAAVALVIWSPVYFEPLYWASGIGVLLAAALGIWCLQFWLSGRIVIAAVLGCLAVWCHDVALFLPYIALIHRPRRWYWGSIAIKVLSLVAVWFSFHEFVTLPHAYQPSAHPMDLLRSALTLWAGLVWPGTDGGPMIVGALVIAAGIFVTLRFKDVRTWMVVAFLSPAPTLFASEHARTYYLAVALPVLAVVVARLWGPRLWYVAVAAAVVGLTYDQYSMTTGNNRVVQQRVSADMVDFGHADPHASRMHWFASGWGYADSVRADLKRADDD